MFLPDYVLKAMDILKSGGFEAYAVGGCVRDALLGETPDDYDIAVSSEPAETERCFSDFRCIETGIKHGTVTVIIDGHTTELTTFRRDGEYRDNRHPARVSFTRGIQSDLARRDFTVNAMAYSPERGLIDLFGGQSDLQTGILRCVGDPYRRFEEDALRIMRCVRFASTLGFEIEAATARAALARAPLLKNISAERRFTELKKLLCGKNARRVLTGYREILEAAVPELNGIPPDEYALAADRTGAVPGTELKLTLFLSPLGAEKADRALCGLKCDNRQRGITEFILKNAEREFSSAGEVKRFAGENGVDKARLLSVYRHTAGKTDDAILNDGIKAASEKNACLTVAGLAVNGTDLAAMGYKGKDIGAALSRLLRAVTDGEVKNERAALINRAEKSNAEKSADL